MQSLLSMNGMDKAFSGVPALRQACLEIAPGEVHALIGQNGAGKSTMIKILTGVYSKDSGDICFDGQDADIASPGQAQKSGIATIYQELNLVPLRSVTENVVMGYEPKRLGMFVNWPEAHRRTREILSRFGIDIDVKAPLGTYSTAIQQLVAIARAVSLNAKLVIMDEPTSSLDDREVEVLFGVVQELKSSGVSVLYVSHFLDELFKICDRVTTMRDGQTVSVRTITETSKLELIADMLGRNVEDIEAAGMTDLGGGEKQLGNVLLETSAIATDQRLFEFNLSVRRGEIVGLGGLLGSGRTEAARALFGVDAVTQGDIRLKGKSWTPTSPAGAIADRIGMLTEDRKAEGIVPDMSVRENMTLALLPKLSRSGRINTTREREIVDEYIAALGIKTSDMDQPIRELSGGNQQKVLLARWLATEPELLILDEPTRGVDVGAKLEIQAIIRQYVDRGFGVVLISSEFEELVEGADRIVVLQDGYSVATLENPGITEDALVKAIAHHHNEEHA
ncbi:sugar ABC transporter ATP-binding protein [Hoeflea prorocentri]|uniref:Sugar ABC transporter ATP-binding protein n=1 Tax=Hoeflea prorocentri TaxID=1922333 RepID=A0A9X3ZHT6_9HYPH|nr:sugar ABC transporter ATP-binding protein [Hoeflea prorocentri]MCY6382182.1 sugar ABC transporter ATP-binding protein [Hoeflea prorocentri]MDA5399982.1 sugar ABC transporter ATP-binding protein [Hoeflea prorocentri]